MRRSIRDDGYIKAKLSVALEVPSDIKHVLKEVADLALNFDKTNILVKGADSVVGRCPLDMRSMAVEGASSYRLLLQLRLCAFQSVCT